MLKHLCSGVISVNGFPTYHANPHISSPNFSSMAICSMRARHHWSNAYCKGQTKFAVVAVDYFTKWAEAEPLTQITEKKTTGFIWKSIICRFGIPQAIVINNRKQFDNPCFKGLCEGLEIKNFFSYPAHPQANRQVKTVNKIIKHHLKTKLEKHKEAYADELLFALWTYRTTHTTPTGETLYSLVFRT